MQAFRVIKSLLLLGAFLLSACSLGMKEDFMAKAKQQNSQIEHWGQIEIGQEVTILGDLIVSPKLDSLVSEALAANPSLQQTLLALRIKQTEYRQASGSQMPSVEAAASTSKEENGDTTYSGTISIGWQLDFWQKLADETDAAAKDVAEQQALYQSARDTLAAEVMKSWLGLITAQTNLGIEEERVVLLEKDENFILQRYRNGLGSLEDLNSARTRIASSKATVEGYRETLAQELRTLKTLLGRTTNSDIIVPDAYPTVLVPLVELPGQTLQRRPDLKAAYVAIEAASLRSSAAYKELLPNINLKAALEDVASSPKALLLNDPVWSLLGQLTAPLYQGGQLKAAAEKAELKTAQAYQAYRETLLSAVNEVENAIGQEQSLDRRQAHLEKALSSARDNVSQYLSSYRAGLVSILDLLNVQEQTFDLEQQLNNLIYQRLANRIDLGLALGLGAK